MEGPENLRQVCACICVCPYCNRKAAVRLMCQKASSAGHYKYVYP